VPDRNCGHTRARRLTDNAVLGSPNLSVAPSGHLDGVAFDQRQRGDVRLVSAAAMVASSPVGWLKGSSVISKVGRATANRPCMPALKLSMPLCQLGLHLCMQPLAPS
jgi:hypothetical protein